MKEEVFIPSVPTLTFMTLGTGGVRVITKLYGPVDDARKEREKRAAEHRADQLSK